MCLQTVTQFLLITKVQGFLTFFLFLGGVFFFFREQAYSLFTVPRASVYE